MTPPHHASPPPPPASLRAEQDHALQQWIRGSVLIGAFMCVACVLIFLSGEWRVNDASQAADELRDQVEDLQGEVEELQLVGECRSAATIAADDARFLDRIDERIAVGYILQSGLDRRPKEQLVAELEASVPSLLLPEPQLTAFLRKAQIARAQTLSECTPQAIEARRAAGIPNPVAPPTASTVTSTIPGGSP